jgi:hypothetical protein
LESSELVTLGAFKSVPSKLVALGPSKLISLESSELVPLESSLLVESSKLVPLESSLLVESSKLATLEAPGTVWSSKLVALKSSKLVDVPIPEVVVAPEVGGLAHLRRRRGAGLVGDEPAAALR